MLPRLIKHFSCRCILAIIIILTLTNIVREWSWFWSSRHSAQRKFQISEDKPDTFNKSRNFRQEDRDREPINCNISKVGVPCHTPPFMIDLECVPHPPVIKDAFNTTLQSSNITIVTGYFNLGSFRKGDSLSYSSDLFKVWMQRLSPIHNYMLIFVEDNTTEAIVRKVRSSLPSHWTKIICIKRANLWAFQIEDAIRKIYSVPCYPKFHPNTVLPSYSCVMHAKYDLLRLAVQKNYFKTKYFSWLDVGYFRDEPVDGPPFFLGLPGHFNEETVAYTEVYPRELGKKCKDIVFANSVWVGGGYFVGRGDVILTWVTQYQSYVYNMLRSGLMSTDQQVIYCMFNAQTHPSRANIQVYKAQNEYHDWFTLGYLSRRRKS